jgi:hypothetical protein
LHFWKSGLEPEKGLYPLMDKKNSVQDVGLALLKRTGLSGSMFSPSMGHAGSVTKAIVVKTAITHSTTRR